MILPFVVEKTSYEDILTNSDFYIDHFLRNGVLIFKSLPLEEKEQLSIMEKFASKLGWGHIPPLDIENHSLTINRWGSNTRSDTEMLIPWHLEHSYKKDRQIAASWHMTKFDCPKTSGTTGFVNSDDVLNKMREDWVDLLRSSIVCHDTSEISIKPIHRNPITTHRNSSKEILNFAPTGSKDFLISVNNEPPTNEHIDKFELIKEFIDDTVQSHNNKPEHWHEWDLNDLVMIDLTNVYHSVKGGFEVEQRKFRRYWAYLSEESLHRSEEQEIWPDEFGTAQYWLNRYGIEI
jgi:alpha-ketoglutarate-dependent taurine dioxygenase